MNAEDFGAGAVIITHNISSKAEFETTIGALTSNSNHVFNITGTIDVTGSYIEPAANAKVSLRGGGTLHKSTGTSTLLFNLSKSGSKLILRDATLKGHAGNTVSLVLVDNSEASFIMHGGAIRDNNASIYCGGAVYVDEGTFTMSGGTISNNSADYGGGVFIRASSGATFTKTGGTIYGDTDTNHGDDATENTATGGTYGAGHAVFVYVDGSSGDKERNATAGTGVNLDSGTSNNWGQ